MEHKDAVETIQKEGKTLLKDLFRFERYFFLEFLFYIHIVVQVVALIAYLMAAFSTGNILHALGMIVLYPLVFFYIRFIFEFMSVLFSVNKNLVDIKNKK